MRITPLLLLVLSAPVLADEPTDIPFDLHIRTIWSEPVLSPGGSAPGNGHATGTWSAHRTFVAVDPATDKPYRGVSLSFDPRKIDRAFRIDNPRPFLGEPIVVGFSIHNRGNVPFEQPVGGNYRARGRDDNFRFLLQREDGSFVPDPYGPMDFSMGGLMTTWKIEPTQIRSLHLPMQQWCAITQPGKYTLHCLHNNPSLKVEGWIDAGIASMSDEDRTRYDVNEQGQLVEKATNKAGGRRMTPTWRPQPHPTPSPLVEKMPTALRKELGDGATNVTDYAAIQIDVIAPTPDERATMHQKWLGRVSFVDDDPSDGFHAAAKTALLFVQQDDWLDVIQRDALPRADHYPVAVALGMHPTPRALELLTSLPPEHQINATFWTPADRKAAIVPLLIGLMGKDHDLHIQRLAAQRLTYLTGQIYDNRIFGEEAMRITADEFAAMQAQFRQWWQDNRATFLPKSR